MTKRIFTFLVAFLATLSGAVWGQEYKATIDLSNPDNSTGEGYTYPVYVAFQGNVPCFRITENGIYHVTGSSDEVYIEIGQNDIVWNYVTDVTLVLDNVTMTSSGYNNRGPIWVYNRGEGTEPVVKIQLKGENHITNSSGSGAGININNNVDLIIEDADNLDGILYVEGNVGIGNPDGGTGDIQINGGTVVASGYPGIGGTDLDNITKFTLNGNAFVVANGLKVTPNLTKGIFCDNSNGNTIATVYGDVVLNSTYPDDENYQLKIDQNATLTLGEGYTLPKDRMANITEDKDRFKAFEVEWLANAIAGDNPTATLPNLYYGTNINVTEGVSYKCDNNLHLSIGWLRDNTTNVVTSVFTDGSASSSLKSIRVGCAWIDADRTINGTTKKPLADATLRVYPTTITNVSFKDDDASLPTGISLGQDGKTLSGTASSEGTTEVFLPVYIDNNTAVGENVGTTVTFNIQEETDYVIDTKNSNNKVSGSAVYSGAAIDHSTFEDQFITLYFTQDKGKGAEATNIYFDIVSCTYSPFIDDNGTLGTEQTGVTEIKNAGVYKNFIIKATDDQDVSLSEGTEYTITSGQFTINKATVTVTPTGTLSANESDTETLPTIQYETTSTVDSKIETPAFDGALALEAIDGSSITDLTKPGTYKIVQGTLKLKENKQFNPSNYTLKVAEGSTFVIKDDISDNTNVTVTVNGADDLTYKGTAYTVADYVTVEGLDEGTYQVSVKKDGNFAYLRNAGTYTVVIRGTGDAAFGDYETTETITVKQAPINSIKANDQTIAIGEAVKTDATANPEIITINGLVNSEQAAFTAGTVSVDKNVDVNIAGQYTDALSISTLTIAEQSEGFLKANYSGWERFTTDNYGKGTLTVTDDSGIDIELPEEGSILVDDGDGTYSLVYDGKAHTDLLDNTTITIKIGDAEPVALTTDDYEVSFSKVGDDSFQETTSPWNVGTYHATITVTKDEEGYKDKSTIVVFDITQRPLTIAIKDQTIEADAKSITTEITDETVTVSGEVAGETAVFTESSSLTCTQSSFTAGTVYEGAITKGSTFELGNGEAGNNFKATNYSLPTDIAAADLTVKQSIDGGDGTDPIDPTDPNDENNPIILPDGWTWDATSKGFRVTYDGNDHEVSALKVKFTDSESGESTYKDLASEYIEDVTYSPATPHDAGDYTASIEIKENDLIKAGTYTIKLQVVKREMHVNFDLPSTITSTDPLQITNERVEYEGQSGNRGLLKKEQYPTIQSGQFIFGEPNEEGKCTVKVSNFMLATSTSGFKPGNYQLQIWDASQGKYINYNGGEIVIIDPENPDDNNPNNPDGGDGGITVDPDGGDQDGDGYVDYLYYYNIYEDQICEGVTVEFSRDVVREGQSVLVTVKVDEEFDVTKLALQFKRSLFGTWEDLTLTPTENPNEYIIKNIYTDIYVRAEGAVPTGIESIDGAKVYTKDGSLFVQTPQLENVTIVTITGAIVKSEQQVGLKQYTGLQRGIYVVRVGEQVFKVRN